jgi:hypothetical protein
VHIEAIGTVVYLPDTQINKFNQLGAKAALHDIAIGGKAKREDFLIRQPNQPSEVDRAAWPFISGCRELAWHHVMMPPNALAPDQSGNRRYKDLLAGRLRDYRGARPSASDVRVVVAAVEKERDGALTQALTHECAVAIAEGASAGRGRAQLGREAGRPGRICDMFTCRERLRWNTLRRICRWPEHQFSLSKMIMARAGAKVIATVWGRP